MGENTTSKPSLSPVPYQVMKSSSLNIESYIEVDINISPQCKCSKRFEVYVLLSYHCTGLDKSFHFELIPPIKLFYIYQ